MWAHSLRCFFRIDISGAVMLAGGRRFSLCFQHAFRSANLFPWCPYAGFACHDCSLIFTSVNSKSELTSRCSSRESLKRNAFMISRALRRTPQELYARACQPCGRLVLVYDYELQRMRILGPYSSVEHRIDFQQLTFNCRRCR
ncbi:hypothetical protein TGRUB_288010 [Toxoplasma gondii RUB]|uniref:Uncharacterized protein n=11 Tax=Toxoplasma gondii TaxID=5811 RepID=A0A125YUR6_TOXGV|nr:hypothetical protein TGGT1_288010 [Toxoplasma gondii GT1]ESS33844.1 hypothetical protein TGVEG_288010 [Toxoplasma gondii VEG]KAF4644305.1 hypothetical protein TGRH88_012970 [Toxoplasma gondii]KFG28957.1 hypothetical protein TGP89_288010 [Toxoplasma gondii p89]KFG43015.1 hypothetical protein TGDOM2_288010 [Toxoplasma gondii GAB2-2007-GAL-DOM2]KFG53156.1 hypothetical protein TGFOU_288010 [Toxoplasma gondii FOU]KFG62520.1 hypothetical protein TGRUB_288010 [Toxoplasma gondii RUB]KFH08731.1 hy